MYIYMNVCECEKLCYLLFLVIIFVFFDIFDNGLRVDLWYLVRMFFQVEKYIRYDQGFQLCLLQLNDFWLYGACSRCYLCFVQMFLRFFYCSYVFLKFVFVIFFQEIFKSYLNYFVYMYRESEMFGE